MPQLSKANIKVIKDAEKAGLISSGIATALYEKSARNQTSLRDISFILTLLRSLEAKPQKK